MRRRFEEIAIGGSDWGNLVLELGVRAELNLNLNGTRSRLGFFERVRCSPSPREGK